MAEEKTVVTTPMDERHFSALEFVKRAIGFSTNVDAVRRAVIDLARANGWQDPQLPAPASTQPTTLHCSRETLSSTLRPPAPAQPKGRKQ